jgi:hypothetical protein
VRHAHILALGVLQDPLLLLGLDLYDLLLVVLLLQHRIRRSSIGRGDHVL